MNDKDTKTIPVKENVFFIEKFSRHNFNNNLKLQLISTKKAPNFLNAFNFIYLK